jgi:hypothetical protein
MATLVLNLTEDEQRAAKTRAEELGYETLEAYIVSLVSSDAELPVSDQLEGELLKAMATPAREMSPADWNEKRRRLIEQHRQAKAG